MKRTVYIETTVPSFYHEARSEPAMIARRESTRRWWQEEAPHFELSISAFVIGELSRGDYPGKAEALRLIDALPLLEVVPQVEEIAGVYIDRRLMPQDDLGDAYHLAIVSYYAVDFLLTWNCRHLANASKNQHLRVVNTELGLYVPIITTPDLLFHEEPDDAQE